MRRFHLAMMLVALCVCATPPSIAAARPLTITSAPGPTWASSSSQPLSAAGAMSKDDWSTYWVPAAPTGTLAIEGTIYNTDTVAYTDVLVTVTFLDAQSRPMMSSTGPGYTHLVQPGAMTTFSWTGVAPAGYSSVAWSATGQPARPGAVAYEHTVATSLSIDASGYRHRTGNVVNSSGATVTSFIPRGWETQGATEDSATHAHTLVPAATPPLLTPVVFPGGSIPFDVLGRFLDDGDPTTSWYHYLSFQSVGVAPRPVYRFFKPSVGAHFYTSSEVERGNVMATLGHVYRYEGVSYNVNTASPSNMRPLYRFHRPSTGTHFYTASTAERDNVMATLGHVYRYEGVAYEVSTYPYFGTPVYRFYRPGNGTHFYTASAVERDNVMATLGHVYAYEGVAFYLAY